MQQSDFNSELKTQNSKPQPVECLGMQFESGEARRDHFTGLLREKLRDPEFRKIEGFPIGEDEDILNLSDPPYYTACPNPWIGDFIAQYGKPYDPKEKYHREPFAADVSEGKNHPIYNAHSYHTKVPHRAIMRYILHYTEPGEVVFDGFWGTGMTGVAAQLCGDEQEVRELGYRVDGDGTIYSEEGRAFSKLGARRAVLNDLSPAATFIAYNYNTPVDIEGFEREAKRILMEVEKECGWMYETKHTDGRSGTINFVLWSDILICPECGSDFIFWEQAFNYKKGTVESAFSCPHCSVELTKRNSKRQWVKKLEENSGAVIEQAKQIPVLINYTIDGKRFEKKVDSDDLQLIQKISDQKIPYDFPIDELPPGFNTHQPKVSHGLTRVHHFYTKRNLWALAAFWERVNYSPCKRSLIQFFVGSLRLVSKQAKHNKERRTENTGLGWVNAGVMGTLYVSSCPAEQSVLFFFHKKVNKLSSFGRSSSLALLSVCSTTQQQASGDSLDYIFLDPPFGANLNYSELSFNWESWLRVKTDNSREAIENKIQGKGLGEYRQLMTDCFKEANRLLKPGRWMTVEFSNTQSVVWNSIQSALTEAGFGVAECFCIR